MRKDTNVFFVYRILFVIFVVLVLAGTVFQLLYVNSYKNPVDTEEIESIIRHKEYTADANMVQMKKMLERCSEDSLRYFAFKPLSESYYVYRNKELIFWSDNLLKQIDVNSSKWKYYTTPNASVLAKAIEINEYKIVSYVLLKFNFPYENKDLSNNFAKEFGLSKDIKIAENEPISKYAIRDGRSYLFSLELPEHRIYNELYAKITLVLFAVAFLLFFYLLAHLPLLFKRKYIPRNIFLLVVGLTSATVYFLLKMSFPSAFFQNSVFTSYHYATNNILSTLTHLTFFSAFVFAIIYLYSFFTIRKQTNVSFRNVFRVFNYTLPVVYYTAMFYVLHELVFNSSTYLNVLQVDDISLTTVWNHFLLLIWGVGYLFLFERTHKDIRNKILKSIVTDVLFVVPLIFLYVHLFDKYAKEAVGYYLLLTATVYMPLLFNKLKKSNLFYAIYIFVFTLFVVNNSILMNSDKKMGQYRLMAENLYFNESIQEERMTESMLRDFETDIKKDSFFYHSVVYPDSVVQVNDYLNGKYLRGFWNRYEMKLFATYPNSDLDVLYQGLLSDGNKISNTDFYRISDASSSVSYIGYMDLRRNQTDTVHVYLEFYPNSNYKSYSYPDLLVETPPVLESKLNLATARYSFGDLIYSSGKFKYPRNTKWVDKSTNDFFIQDDDGYRHYIYVPSKYGYMIISEGNIPNIFTYFIYFLYTFVAFFVFSIFLFWAYKFIHRERFTFNLTSRLLISFISLMIVCFGAIFYLALHYTQNKYKEKQKTEIGLKKNYIQSALQEKYYWNQNLDSTMTNALNFELQDLSYTYRTDINVYDNNGVLIGSSQPMIFSKNLISKSISPKPFFSNDPNLNQYEHIGKLEYLATYTDFYNGDFLQIGYISIPQFLSNDEYKAEVQSFFVVLVHISLAVITLFILISIFIGRRLTAPLTIIENRLKDIRLGKENKKIDYKSNDEIGQLVAQYNRTVDELEKSAHLLATSERDTAWKTMARQVAHEINNPLTPMKLTIQQLQRTKRMNSEQFDSYFEKSTATLIEQIENLTRIAGSFSTFARLPEPNFEKVDVANNIWLVVQLFSSNNEKIDISYEGEENGIFAHTDREQLVQVFNNLLKNAMQAIPSDRKGQIKVRLTHTAKEVLIHFEDNGKGVSDDIKDKLFVPNFTTKSTGMGLGLAISKNIIKASKGDITFVSQKNIGTVFTVRLPKMS